MLRWGVPYRYLVASHADGKKWDGGKSLPRDSCRQERLVFTEFVREALVPQVRRWVTTILPSRASRTTLTITMPFYVWQEDPDAVPQSRNGAAVFRGELRPLEELLNVDLNTARR